MLSHNVLQMCNDKEVGEKSDTEDNKIAMEVNKKILKFSIISSIPLIY